MGEVRFVHPFDGVFDEDGVQVSSGQDDRGRELPDPVPMAPPVGYRQPPTLADMIRRMVQSEVLRRAAAVEEFDSFEEAEDFEIEDDPIDPKTPYEAVFDPPATPPPATSSSPPVPLPGSQVAPPVEVPPVAQPAVPAVEEGTHT